MGIFLFYFIENFYISDGWETLSIRSIDDYAIQVSIHNLQKMIMAGEWRKAISFFDYAYGNGFWLLNSLLLLPFVNLDGGQILIILGRQISLFFVFGSIYIYSLIIDVLKPINANLKYPILVCIALAPMVAIISTKFHVNAQALFFGVLSYYLLIIPGNRYYLSGVTFGVALGFKLTSVLLFPLLILTLLEKISQKSLKKILTVSILYSLLVLIVAALITKPAHLFFFNSSYEWLKTFETIFFFKKMHGDIVPLGGTIIYESLDYYYPPICATAFFLLFIFQVTGDLKKGNHLSTYILLTLIIGFIAVVLVEHKGAIYIASYFISIAFFLPLGLLGILNLKFISSKNYILVAYLILMLGFAIENTHRNKIFESYNFYAISKQEKILNKIKALNEIKAVVFPLPLRVSILQDANSAFPATPFNDGVQITMIYGDLRLKSNDGIFDYILLNKEDYYGKGANTIDAAIEEKIRNQIINTKEFNGNRYQLIYNANDYLLYKLNNK